MGDRFYQAQIQATGTCPGAPLTTNRRKRKMAWTDEKKAEVIAAYEAQNPTPESSMEIVAEIATEFEESPNGVRMVLTKAGVYVKKTPATKGTQPGNSGPARVSKAAAIEALLGALSDAGQPADEDATAMIEKMTGKAAMYFAGVITAINS